MKRIPFVLYTVAVLLMGSCNRADTHGATDAKASKNESTSAKNSIYLLDNTWQNQDGKTVMLKELKGKPVVVAMIFTHCMYACPHIVSDMHAFQDKLSPAEKQKTRFLLVSFDIDRDSSAVLHAYAKKMNLDQNWTLLHGNEVQTRELSALLNLSYEKQEGGAFAHSNMISILDASGNLVFQQEGIDADQAGLLSTLQRLEN